MDYTGPFAFKFGAVCAAVGGLYNIVASFIVRATGDPMPLIGASRNSINSAPDPNLYLSFGVMILIGAPILWLIGNKLDED